MRARRALVVAIMVMAVSVAVLTKALNWEAGVQAGTTVLVSGSVLALAGTAAFRILRASERSHDFDRATGSEHALVGRLRSQTAQNDTRSSHDA